MDRGLHLAAGEALHKALSIGERPADQAEAGLLLMERESVTVLTSRADPLPEKRAKVEENIDHDIKNSGWVSAATINIC